MAGRVTTNNAVKQRANRRRKEISSNDQKIVADWMSGIEKRKPAGLATKKRAEQVEALQRV
jgi:hypothetical protein